MNKKRHYRRFLLLLAMLSAATFANAQNGTKDYKVSGIVPDGINKIYIYKNNGLSSREMLDSVTRLRPAFFRNDKRCQQHSILQRW